MLFVTPGCPTGSCLCTSQLFQLGGIINNHYGLRNLVPSHRQRVVRAFELMFDSDFHEYGNDSNIWATSRHFFSSNKEEGLCFNLIPFHPLLFLLRNAPASLLTTAGVETVITRFTLWSCLPVICIIDLKIFFLIISEALLNLHPFQPHLRPLS